MGVDFYNCKMCNEIYSDCGDYGRCENCMQSWCYVCKKSGAVEQFYVGDDLYCDFCFSDEPPAYTKKELLQLALKQLGKTKAEFIASLPQKEADHCYECFEFSDTHLCGDQNCANIKDDYYDENESDDEKFPTRGVCCWIRYKDSKDDWCVACSKKNKLDHDE